jgi:hypothetical protein
VDLEPVELVCAGVFKNILSICLPALACCLWLFHICLSLVC